MSAGTDSLDIGGGTSRSLKERAIEGLLFLCAALSVFVTGAIIFTLTIDAIEFFTQISPASFFLGERWTPAIEPLSFGVLPRVNGTLLVTVLSALIALPTGVGAAIYLSEYASSRVRSVIKPGLEMLVGIPTVVYGYFALVYITPVLGALGLPVSTFNVLSASIMVGVMIIPMVSSLSEDAMNAVGETMTSAMVELGTSDVSGGTPAYKSLLARPRRSSTRREARSTGSARCRARSSRGRANPARNSSTACSLPVSSPCWS